MPKDDLGASSATTRLSPSVEPASSLDGSATSIPSAVGRWSDRLMGVMAVLDSWTEMSPMQRNQEIWRINVEVADIIAEMAIFTRDSDTHPQGGDGTAPFMGSAGREASPVTPCKETNNGK